MASSEVIRFDSDYMRNYSKTVSQAKESVDEAIALLRKANRHDGWKCAERSEINEDLDEIKKQLSNIADNGITPIASALSRGADQFSELETRASTQESQMSQAMRKDWGVKPSRWQRIKDAITDFFKNKPWTGGTSPIRNDIVRPLPVTPIPRLPSLPKLPALPKLPDRMPITDGKIPGPGANVNIGELQPGFGNIKAPGLPDWVSGVVNKLLGR